ncbi:hypothetical protein [Plasticicumulans sp.]
MGAYDKANELIMDLSRRAPGNVEDYGAARLVGSQAGKNINGCSEVFD